MWVWSGLILSLGLAGVAWWRSRATARTFYEGEVYGMDAWAHRKWAAGFAFALVIFSADLRLPGIISNNIPNAGLFMEALLGAVILAGILYLATFARGATGEDE